MMPITQQHLLKIWFKRHFQIMARCGWVIMLLGHVWALVRRLSEIAWVSPSQADLATLLLLILVSVFFTLKIVNVSWLRFKVDRQSVLMLTLIVALMHSNVVQQSDQPLSNFESILVLSSISICTSLLVVRAAARFMRQRFTRMIQHLTHLARYGFDPQPSLLALLPQQYFFTIHSGPAPPTPKI